MRECNIYIVNLFFGLDWYLTENTAYVGYDNQSR